MRAKSHQKDLFDGPDSAFVGPDRQTFNHKYFIVELSRVNRSKSSTGHIPSMVCILPLDIQYSNQHWDIMPLNFKECDLFINGLLVNSDTDNVRV